METDAIMLAIGINYLNISAVHKYFHNDVLFVILDLHFSALDLK